MIYSLFYSVMSLSAVMSMVYTIQMTSLDTMVYAISPTLYEQHLYRNENAEWTFDRSRLTLALREQLEGNRGIIFEDIEIKITYYQQATLLACDELAIPCTAVQLEVQVDYSLFIQERVYRYELLTR